ncbi:MAG: dihydrofolate reductase [Nocardioidaceae bacterium]
MRVTIVAAVASNGVIGGDGGLPWHLPEDLRRVKSLTLGHVLVMGRRTFEWIGRPLPQRTTAVVTRQPDWRAEGVLTAPTVEEALTLAGELDDEVFVLGGSEVYRAVLPVSDRLALTWVDDSPEGDTVFPEVDWSGWHETAREAHDGFAFVTYQRGSSAKRAGEP